MGPPDPYDAASSAQVASTGRSKHGWWDFGSEQHPTVMLRSFGGQPRDARNGAGGQPQQARDKPEVTTDRLVDTCGHKEDDFALPPMPEDVRMTRRRHWQTQDTVSAHSTPPQRMEWRGPRRSMGRSLAILEKERVDQRIPTGGITRTRLGGRARCRHLARRSTCRRCARLPAATGTASERAQPEAGILALGDGIANAQRLAPRPRQRRLTDRRQAAMVGAEATSYAYSLRGPGCAWFRAGSRVPPLSAVPLTSRARSDMMYVQYKGMTWKLSSYRQGRGARDSERVEAGV